MINKIHYDDDQPELLQLCEGHMYEYIEDFNALNKSAASKLFSASDLDAVRPDKNHFLIHNIGMGDYETYAQNKNGDGWPKQACVDRHHTFVTDGAFFREHRNRSKKESIGAIKLAGFHPDLRRIETVLWGDKRKAEEEYEMAKAGKALAFSMSARVPDDRCSCCGQRSKKASLYCDHLKHHMNQWMPEFKKFAFAYNDRPTFYDMSRVRTPADRIAHYLEYRFGDDELKKAASADLVISGAEWAEFEGVCVPDTQEADPFPVIKCAMLLELAAEEQWLTEHEHDKSASLKNAFVRDIIPHSAARELTDAELQEVRSLRPGSFMYEMAKRAAVLPFISFCAYATGKSMAETLEDGAVKHAATMLHSVFSRMLDLGNDIQLANLMESGGKYLTDCDAAKTASVTACLNTLGEALTIDPDALRHRILIQDMDYNKPRMDIESVKSAASNASDVLAIAYGHYQLNALCDMESISGEDISEPQKTLVVGHNRHVYR